MRTLIVLLLTVGLAGCSPHAAWESLVPEDDVAFAQAFLSDVQTGDFARTRKQWEPSLRDDPHLADGLAQIVALFPAEPPREVRTVGFHVAHHPDVTAVRLTLEYEYSDRWLLAAMSLERAADTPPLVHGLHVEVRPESLAHTNRFDLTDGTMTHYLVLGLATAIALFTLGTLVVALRTPIRRRKWLWVAFILIGFVNVSLNWTTGEIGIEPVSVRIPVSGFERAGPYAPVVILTSVPLGAITFLLRRNKLMAPLEEIGDL